MSKSLDEFELNCPQCDQPFILSLSKAANGNIYVCQDCGAEIEFSDEVLRQMADALHGIKVRKCN